MTAVLKKYWAVLALPSGDTIEIPVHVTTTLRLPDADNPNGLPTPGTPNTTIMMQAHLMRLRDNEGYTYTLTLLDDTRALFMARCEVKQITVTVGNDD